MEIATKTDDELLAFAASPDPARIDELNLADLNDCYARHPTSYALSSLVGLITQRTIEKARRPTEESKRASKRDYLERLAYERARPDWDAGAFWAFVDERHPNGRCPGCDQVIHGFGLRQGSDWYCNRGGCDHRENMMAYWTEHHWNATEREATGAGA